jgi:hypothetical protein
MASGATTGSSGVVTDVSREPKDEWAPPRNTLRASSNSGWAFWRGLFSLPAAFLLVFVLVGSSLVNLGAWGTFWAPERARESADPRFYLAAMAFGAVFVLVAVSMLRVVLTSEAQGRRLRARPAAEGPPWTWDHPWRRDAMGPDYEKQGAGGAFGPLAIHSLIALFNIALPSGPWLLKLLALVFDAFGLLILYDVVTRAVNSIRFRRPTIAWQTFPAPTGGPLNGTIRFAVPLDATGPASVTLRCVRDKPGGASENEGALKPVSIYRETRKYETPAPLGTLDIGFQVPRDLPGTDLAREEAVYWQVVVQVPVSGPDFGAVFLAPVYAPVAE